MKWRRRQGLAHQTIEGETLIVVPKERLYHALNEVGSHLWAALEREQTIDALVEGLCEEFEVEGDAARKDVEEFLSKMKSLSLVESWS